jgi:hypothetical protein
MKKKSLIERTIEWLDFCERRMVESVNGADGNTYSVKAMETNKKHLKQLRADRNALKKLVS